MPIKYTFSYNHTTKAMLYLVPTPIGNIGDITLRSKEIFLSADIIASEDTRKTKELFNKLGILNKNIVSCYSQTEKDTAEKLIKKIKTEDLVLAYCSDAGTPGISDPGGLLVKEAISNDIPVSTLPGPTAFVPALTASGFDTSKFTFLGFLPIKENSRNSLLTAHVNRPETLIIYEAPHRLRKTLIAINEVYESSRHVVLAREISKVYEQYIRGTIKELQELDEAVIRGEFIIIIAGQEQKEQLKDDEIIEQLKYQISLGKSLSRSCREISELYDINKNKIYKLALQYGLND